MRIERLTIGRQHNAAASVRQHAPIFSECHSTKSASCIAVVVVVVVVVLTVVVFCLMGAKHQFSRRRPV